MQLARRALVLVGRDFHSMTLINTDHQSSRRHSSEGHWPGWQSCEQDNWNRGQSRQQNHRHRRIRRQQDRQWCDRYVRARRFKHGWPTRRDRAVASRLAHEQVESRRRGSPSMKKTSEPFLHFCGHQIVVNADGCHQVNSTRRQAATLLLCPRRSTKRLRALLRPSAMLARVPLALPARLVTMLATLPRVLLAT